MLVIIKILIITIDVSNFIVNFVAYFSKDIPKTKIWNEIII